MTEQRGTLPVQWLQMIYRIPRKPTSARVYVWRKLNQLGAISLQDAVWTLPATDRNREQFRWIAAEISEMGGEVSLFESGLLTSNAQPTLRERFDEPVRTAYEEILVALKRRKPDRIALSKKYQQIKSRDFFECSLGNKVRAKLLAAQGEVP
jgi:hypothetical protein